ncbi:MAG: hypothetical protein AAF288_13620 [Planctomycetota bacterium]
MSSPTLAKPDADTPDTPHAADASDASDTAGAAEAQAQAQDSEDAGATDAAEPDSQAKAAFIPVQPPPAVDPNAGFFARLVQRIERKLSTLSTRNNFWHRAMARVFLPLAWRSGIKQVEAGGSTPFSVLLPFRRFNKNWYNAMAGAALLANSEVAGGMFIFGKVGGEYTVVCKELHYKFTRPCLGPAIYQVTPKADIDQLKREKLEFNVPIEMNIYQAVVHKDERQRRVGRCSATFHVAPKAKLRERKKRAKERSLKA